MIVTKELLLEISYDCNFNCIHCSSINCSGKVRIKDLDNIKNIIDIIDVVRLSGGEALLNKDLVEYVNYFYDRDIKIILQTNGSLDIPSEIYNKIHQINLSIYSNEEVHNFITMNNCSFKRCCNIIEDYSNITLCSPIFSLTDSTNIIKLANSYNLPVRFTSLLNHGRCNFAKPIEEQIDIFNTIKKLGNIIPHCSLSTICEQENKFVLKPDLTLLNCASNKQGLSLCKKYIK